MRVVAKYRFVRLAGRVLRILAEHRDTSKVERQKNQYKDQIRGKVTQWLSDFEGGLDASIKEPKDTSAMKETLEGGDRIMTKYGIF